MNTEFASMKAGGREKLADLLGVKLVTTFQPSWKPNLPKKHERYLKAIRPRWFSAWMAEQLKEQAMKAKL